MGSKMLKYIIRQAFQGMFRNKLMAVASIGSVMAVLVILGYMILIMLNINSLAIRAKEEFDEIAVFLVEDMNEQEIKDFGKTLEQIKGVMSVTFQSKEMAMADVKEKWGDDAYLLEGLRNNPYPNTYVVRLQDVKYVDYAIQEIERSGYVEETRYYKDEIVKLMGISELVKKIGIVVIVILILISVYIISNTVKMTVVYRRKEIELMQYIGATNGYVRGPFIIEGIVLGTVGSMLALAIVWVSYNYFSTDLSSYFSQLAGFTSYIVKFREVLEDVIYIFLTIGIGIGTLGSLVSLKKFLNV